MNPTQEPLLAINIHPQALAAMVQDAEARFPNECCGFFYGQDGQNREIIEAIPVPNSKAGDQRRRFEISALDYMQAERYARQHQLQLLGIYHSHPNHPAIPSEHDRKQAVPSFSYIILSVQEGEFDHIRSWQLDEQAQFQEEKIIS